MYATESDSLLQNMDTAKETKIPNKLCAQKKWCRITDWNYNPMLTRALVFFEGSSYYTYKCSTIYASISFRDNGTLIYSSLLEYIDTIYQLFLILSRVLSEHSSFKTLAYYGKFVLICCIGAVYSNIPTTL